MLTLSTGRDASHTRTTSAQNTRSKALHRFNIFLVANGMNTRMQLQELRLALSVRYFGLIRVKLTIFEST